MKFSKSYIQTMTDPAFPKEWREKGLEYKELKKLINGVVAELESLGLSADVLRDLLQPPDEGDTVQKGKASTSSERGAGSSSRLNRSRSASESVSGDEADSHDELTAGLVSSLAKLSTGRPGLSTHIDPLSPLLEEEEARRRSDESRMVIPDADTEGLGEPAMDLSAAPPGQSSRSRPSPAGEWVASLDHAHGDRRHRSRSRTGSRSGSSPDASERSREASVQSVDGDESAVSDDFLKVGGPDNRAKPSTMLSIGRRSFSHNEASGSHDSASPSSSDWRMGKKDLENLRRNSHNGSVRPTVTPDTKRKKRDSRSPEDDQNHDWDGHAWRERQGLGWDLQQDEKRRRQAISRSTVAVPGPSSQAKPRWVQGKDGRRARAEYELGGTTEHPIPRIRLTIESPVHSDDEDNSGDESESALAEDSEQITELPPSPRLSVDASTDETQDDRAPHQHAPASKPQLMKTREILIPLTADTQFLDTLTHSLSQLSELQESQREEFITSTEDLCASVARAASPYASKNDLYVWREIFQLWVDMQIFESQREKDRGELSVDESEARLKRFAEELVKRGWLAQSVTAASSPRLSRKREAIEGALTLPMRDSRSVNAVEDFLRLNLALLDVKKFQRINVEAARKILKKHDKRTALTASSGLRDFVRQQELSRASAAAAASFGMHIPGLSASMGAESTGTLVAPAHGTHPSLAALLPSSTTGLLSESLPHILLSLLTTTLLPILPSVDDYSCAICTGLAWRPIRLDCTHLFCIRCLVKLQKQGKADCPLCRAPNVVKTADGRNLDPATVNMLKMWFPNEVSDKEMENERDRRKEELGELGFESHKCTVM